MINNFLPMIMFLLSVMGIIINRTNLILLLICIEIMLLSITLNILIYTLFLNLIAGQFLSLFIITVAAVETAVGLSIMITFYKIKGSISVRFLNLLKG